MASAVLSSRNEQCWGGRKAYMGNYPKNPTNNTRITSRFNPNPSPTANPHPNLDQNFIQNSSSNPIRQTHDLKKNIRQKNEPPKRLSAPAPSSPAVFSNSELSHRKPEGPVLPKDPFHREYLTFNLASYSRVELKELKKRLTSELQCVRRLLIRIEARPSASRTGSLNPLMRPPPSIQVSPHGLETSAEKRTPKGNQQSRSSGYAKKNDKFKKKISGQKRALPFAAGPESKRPAVPKLDDKKAQNAMMMKCRQILMKLLKLKSAFVFSKPVDVQGLKLHDYYHVIKQPMDLGTVKSRLGKKEYQTPLDFASDVRLTFENALKYNPKGHQVHTMANAMLSKFEGLFQPEYEKYKNEYRNGMTENLVDHNSDEAKSMAVDHNSSEPKSMAMLEGSDLMTPSLPNVMDSHPVQAANTEFRSGKLPKPKARDQNKRPMTLEEKVKLASHLENIPQEKVEQMLQIVTKRNPPLMQEGGEIELDIEALDVETLWELDRLTNYPKRAGCKIRRQDRVENDSITEVKNASISEVLQSQDNGQPPLPEVSGQKNKKLDAGEEDIDIGEEIPGDDFPPVEIEKDPAGASSGSSSCGSSSSSGDDSSSSSDSGSSSESDSDEDSAKSPYVEPKGASAT